ncbi:hypothetical protein H9Q74_007406 [Fusarium xylarioides]|nr:hypothetical protein H9Q71_001407 [Fusarium xylarioides]KAG5822508.1 hypothetical protein H9Q74_007406 [Fusarium xylarioides]
MAGTSTGGLNSIMLGRLRMSVDEAIDNFIDYASAVFGHPREFYALTPGAKYSSAKACEAFTKIISNGIGAWDTNLVRDEPFIPFGENGRRTRTLIVSSYRKNKEVLGYTWKSFGILDSKTQPSHSAKIWEVACATCATPNYFDPAEIKGEKYYDGTVITGPMMCAIEEIYDLHKMIPAVLVNLGKDGIFRTARGDIPVNIGERWREFLGRNKQEDAISRPPSPIIFEQSHLKWYLRSRVYTLSPEEDLDDVPYDDWRPPMLGKQALQKVKDITNDYLEKDEVRAKIRRIAQEAVRIRRARARTEQWKDFV